jgi:hypothetical protein
VDSASWIYFAVDVRVCVTFLHRYEAGKMTVLVGEKGRNRIAAPTHGHEWRIAQSKRHMVAATRDVGKENTIYRHG